MGDWKPPTPIQLAKRVEKWQHRLAHLGISHFRINSVTIDDETPGGPHAQASVRVSENYDNATFWFKWDFINDCTERDLDETIIHEWLHVAMRDLDQALDSAETWMPKATYADWDERIDHEREGLVERLTRTLAEFWYS